jgi:hypothetical protein
MSDSEIQRQLGRGMPIPERDMASERYTVTSKSNVEPEKPKLSFRFIAGIMEVNDGSGWRLATAEEIDQLMRGVACVPRTLLEQRIDDAWARWARRIIDDFEREHDWPSNEEGEL